MLLAVPAICVSLEQSEAAVGDTFTFAGVKYKVTSENPNEVEVSENICTGGIIIPSNVENETTHIQYSVTSIGDRAFYENSELTLVGIPDGVKSIGDWAFQGCTSLTMFQVSGDNQCFSTDDNGVLYNKDQTTLVICPGGYSGSCAIPNSVKSIGDCAFNDCPNLTSVSIPDSVTSISNYNFGGCTSLTKFIVDENNQCYSADDNGVLYNKDKTTLIMCPEGYSGSCAIPNSVTSIGNSAFYCCTKLTSVSIPGSVMSIGDNAFYSCSGLTSVSIPNGVISIGEEAFRDCSGLTSVSISDSVISLGNGAFYSCSGLTSVSIPDSVTSISNNTFYECSGLTSVTIPSSVTSIGTSAFYGCSELTEATIPRSVTSIGGSAFQNCSKLTSVYINSSVPPILGSNVFLSCSKLQVIDVPYGSGDAYKAASVWKTLSKKINDVLVDVPESVTYTYDGTEKTCVQGSGPYAVGGVNSGTNAGDYTVTLTLEPGKNLIWMDNHESIDRSIPWSIAKRQVTVSGITAQNKAYDGTTDATLVYDGVVIDGLVSGDSLGVAATGTFVDANPGVGKTVNIMDLTLNGASASNYVLAETGQQTTTTADIVAEEDEVVSADNNPPLTVMLVCVVAVILFMILTAKIE